MNSTLRRVLMILLAVAGLTAVGVAADWWISAPEDVAVRYVGRDSCAQCHQTELVAWQGSDHDLAMDLATDQTVLADFDDAEFTYQGVTSRMFRRGDEFWIHTEGPDGKMQDFRIKYTFGVRPLQQYMVEFPDGRVQVLRISWDTENKRWFNVPPPDVVDERIEPGDPLHWTGVAQNWNHTCASCHSTDYHKNYDLATDTYHSTFAEIDVSCEACHGPGSLHVDLAESRSLFWDRRHGYGLARLKGEDPQPQLQACAPCHSRRSQVHPEFRPGVPLLDHFEPELLHEGLYHADGQILDEVYVYGSFLQSRMHRENVRCTDCHDPHTTRLKFQGNMLCTQCHTPGKYDGPVHHHHPVGSAGASCVECHMPETTYMVVDPRRDHSIRVPRPDLTVSLGTPNACHGCHTAPDETPAWAAQHVRQWYGPRRPDDPHFAPALAAAREGRPEGEDLLLKLLRRPTTPAIVQATALAHLGQYSTDASRQARVKALASDDPLVRTSAARSVGELPPGRMISALAPLLEDPIRSVRMSAGRRLASMPSALLSAEQRTALEGVLEDYRTAQQMHADRAAAHINLGNLAQDLGQVRQAADAFRAAIRVEPYLSGSRSNLASLLEQSGGDPEEIRRLREEELDVLARDAELLPDNAVVQYRYGLLLYLLSQLDEAEQALERACSLDPSSYDFRLALTLLYEKRAKWQQALQSVQLLAVLRPGDATAAQLAGRIAQQARGAGAAGSSGSP
ncbi:MAG: HEAT repeat domain-containing protein [Pirellulales bacterium]